MKASVYHLQLNVRDAGVSIPFYRDLEYAVVVDTPGLLGMSNGTTDFWIAETPADRRMAVFHRKNAGLNHVAFRVAARDDVDAFTAEFLAPRRIPTLYGGPRDYPEYHRGYYGVFFEDPDRLKLEVAHVPR